MRISNYEATGLADVAEILTVAPGRISVETLRELLKTCNISFVAEEITRLQSTLLCELKDSYVQQSQRYVTIDAKGYVLPAGLDHAECDRAATLIGEALALYQEMTVLKAAFKGRPQPKHYLHGIPIEDARYILPLAVKTNISVAMSGEKLVDLFKLLKNAAYQQIFAEMKAQLAVLLPSAVAIHLDGLDYYYDDTDLLEEFYRQKLADITVENPVQLLASFADLPLKVGLGAITSTMDKTPSEVLKGWGEAGTEKAAAVANRVLGYGHDSVAEQGRTTFGLMFSLVTYHQQERHRLTTNYRESLTTIINDRERQVVLPQTIAQSAFKARYLALAEAFKSFRSLLAEKGRKEQSLHFLLNCDRIKMLMSSNIRIDRNMFSDRICFNAQWEIREIATAKLALLRALAPDLYAKALPSCVYGACREGKYTCGRAAEMRRLYGEERKTCT